MGDVSKRMLPWRILDDKKLVCLNNALVPLCEVMRQMSADHGLVDVQLLDHSLNPKMRPAFWFQSDQTFMFDYSCLMLFGASFTLCKSAPCPRQQMNLNLWQRRSASMSSR